MFYTNFHQFLSFQVTQKHHLVYFSTHFLHFAVKGAKARESSIWYLHTWLPWTQKETRKEAREKERKRRTAASRSWRDPAWTIRGGVCGQLSARFAEQERKNRGEQLRWESTEQLEAAIAEGSRSRSAPVFFSATSSSNLPRSSSLLLHFRRQDAQRLQPPRALTQQAARGLQPSELLQQSTTNRGEIAQTLLSSLDLWTVVVLWGSALYELNWSV